MHEQRWLNVVHAALRLEDWLAAQAPGAAARSEVQVLLGSLLEVFPSSVDPVEDLEGFAVRKLAQALQRALEPEA
jgi:hypothetical protein